MSYPAIVHPLVIEDEAAMQQSYDVIFDEIRKTCPVAQSRHAYCFQDAQRWIQSEDFFHLVILDLRLPEVPDLPAPEGIAFGLSLLNRCKRRDEYPIPALLVISGQVDKARQEELQNAVRDGFFYGRVVVKADLDALQDEVRRAVEAARTYCGLGIHLRDSGRATYPTISPREEDLLRRAAALHGSVGVDVKWWSADRFDRSSEGTGEAWTKVLIGRFLFCGDSPSRLNFFKFVPGSGAEHSVESAKRGQTKLSHIKVNGAVVTDSRALMITERVGAKDDSPISLGEFLSTPKASDSRVLARVVKQISNQVQSLGEIGPQIKPLRELLWRWHDLSRIKSQWAKLQPSAGTASDLSQNPVAILKDRLSSEQSIRVEYQSTVHGDLHFDNVAVDVMNGDTEAFIFDCAGSGGHAAVRDLAHLEVSILLHQQAPDSTDLVRFCASLYACFLPSGPCPEGSTVQANTWEFISQLRAGVSQPKEQIVYALLLLDYALIQLGGLAFGSSHNKVRDPREAALLAALAARLYKALTSVEV